MAGPAFLQCPECKSDVDLCGNTLVCPQCGYCSVPNQAVVDNCPVSLLRAPHQLAVELSKGFAIIRSFMHVCVRRFVRPTGCYIDLGSGKNPSYYQYLKDYDFEYVTADGNSKSDPDILMDLELRFPFREETFDGVLLFNVLEHVYDYRHVLDEIHRILKKGGKLYIVVPYHIKIHGSPLDYFRYTHYSLHRLLSDAGFRDISIYAGGGWFQFLSELFSWLPKLGARYVLYPLCLTLCGFDFLISKISKGKFAYSLPVGYFVECSR